jgi:hypothetical protein
MQNQNTATIAQNKVLFASGALYLTVGAREALLESNQQPLEFLERHQRGDWGIVGKEDSQENEFSLRNGFRLLSAYRAAQGEKIYVITEADRSSKTSLLP